MFEFEKNIPKKVSVSAVDFFPHKISHEDLNPHGILFGGVVLSIADRLAGGVAEKHSGKPCVTLFLDSVRFFNPAYEGEMVVFKAAINRTWHTSMEVGVRVDSENKLHIASMYFTFVSLDENNHPIKTPKVTVETIEQKRRFMEASRRRKIRLKLFPLEKKS